VMRLFCYKITSLQAAAKGEYVAPYQTTYAPPPMPHEILAGTPAETAEAIMVCRKLVYVLLLVIESLACRS
jgi:hypothetical protein